MLRVNILIFFLASLLTNTLQQHNEQADTSPANAEFSEISNSSSDDDEINMLKCDGEYEIFNGKCRKKLNLVRPQQEYPIERHITNVKCAGDYELVYGRCRKKLNLPKPQKEYPIERHIINVKCPEDYELVNGRCRKKLNLPKPQEEYIAKRYIINIKCADDYELVNGKCRKKIYTSSLRREYPIDSYDKINYNRIYLNKLRHYLLLLYIKQYESMVNAQKLLRPRQADQNINIMDIAYNKPYDGGYY